jgi:hypothetical protein
MLRSICLCLFSILFLIQCSTAPAPKNPELVNRSDVQQGTPLEIQISNLDRDKIYGEMRKFRGILNKRRPLSEADWQLHDSLLKTYIQLKFYPRDGVLKVPARTRLSLPLKSYCLDPRRASPETNEVYRWQKLRGETPFLQEILRLSPNGEYSQKMLQGLLWNLKNQTPWEDYPKNDQEILRRVDPAAAVKLPSRIKSKIQGEVLDRLRSELPESAKDAVGTIEGQYADYENFKNALENRRSDQPLPVDKVTPMEGAKVYVENKSSGFDDQNVTFYNASGEDQTMNLNEFYQVPFRRDVQPLAAYFGLKFDPVLFKELEKLLFDDMARLGLSYTPVLGDLIDLYEASTGRNFFTNEYLTNTERFMSAISVLAGSGQTYRYAEKILRGPVNYADDVQRKYRQIRNTESYKELEGLAKEMSGKGIPDDWRVKVSKPGKERQGIEYVHPEVEHTRVRVMPGIPGHKYENSREKYVRVQRNGDFFDKNGNFTKDENASHIPLGDFDISKFPWIKK